ncbi:conserved membrane protein of unknown function [Rhodovastum atsumiense]|uniref:DUF3623 family protein n=1 Tax=Rhodovastum atsumiense TaxID=504468 RepID=A0A5M6IYJ8_9PROT|nr:putative photosynthetic complex assembly protein PuhE [Rhodovastum atsumiense]KAA5612897.1 DUF3623 family protein [Rhodovastum atsumiense]CAH2601021.1 conserved membrane protein of unknown function [Rhodovastum atsumiense]
MSQYLSPALHALFVWWFSTGVVIYLDGLPRRTHRWTMLGSTLVLAFSLYGVWYSSGDVSVGGAYAAFTYGLLAWSWIEVSFYLGYVTGPRKETCADGCSGWRHFGHAIMASLWHELAILALAAVVGALTWEQPNQVGLWIFVVLWWMHQSAKLNVFLGVRNLNEEFIPDHVAFLKSFFTKKPMNLLFPFSITLSTVAAVVVFQRAFAVGADGFTVTGNMSVGAMLALAILEHWLLVLPIPSAALWAWGLRSRPAAHECDIEIVAGFLGAGKTTFMRRLLDQANPAQRTVVLVNDFGALGVDATLLRGRGAEVVELPNGCICCSLRKDLSAQLLSMIARYRPARVLIEPSGVADLAALLGVLHGRDLRACVKTLRVSTVVDAGSFLRDYGRMHALLDAQVQLAHAVVINKADLVSAAELRAIEHTLHGLNPLALVVPATYGAVRPGALDALAADPHRDETDAGASEADETAHAPHGHGGHGRLAEAHVHAHVPAALGMTSWSMVLSGTCDPALLDEVLEATAGGAFGEVERVKGIARTRDGWIRFDVAGGRPSMAAFAAREGEEARVVAIGRRVDQHRLQMAFDACASETTV